MLFIYKYINYIWLCHIHGPPDYDVYFLKQPQKNLYIFTVVKKDIYIN